MNAGNALRKDEPERFLPASLTDLRFPLSVDSTHTREMEAYLDAFQEAFVQAAHEDLIDAEEACAALEAAVSAQTELIAAIRVLEEFMDDLHRSIDDAVEAFERSIA